jgi:FkbM family methyltransferase
MMDPMLIKELARASEFKFPLNLHSAGTYIYGSGKFAQAVRNTLEINNIKVDGFLDHRVSESNKLSDLSVYRPNDPNIGLEQRGKSAVILGIHNRDADLPRIINALKQSGYNRFISPIELYDHFSEELGDRYWLTSRDFYSSRISQVERAYDLLADVKSRETFAALLRFRIGGDYATLPEPDTEHQYFPSDLPAWSNPIRFVDCGAYDGDTLQSLVNAGFRFESVAAFEPEEENFRKLSAYISRNKGFFPNASLFPCGVYSTTTQLKFEMGQGEAGTVYGNDSHMIQCIALDECIPTFQPTLIKMDIEGAEIEALRGAEKVIRDCQPVLAVSIYHTPAHLWEIPLLIHESAQRNYMQYTYHVRAHAHNGFDTIFYAVPSGKTL